ncbi:MAG TPA: hypothetical protein VNB64_08995 [Solirubrobacteraceae bacterium]|nr:hypothetical protein [Solirubrobacteraceae bacterium]
MSGIDRVRALYADWARGDFSTTRGYLAPDVEWHQREVAIEPGVRRGHVVRGRGKETGVPLELRQVVLWTLQDGLVTRVQWFDTRAEAEAASG